MHEYLLYSLLTFLLKKMGIMYWSWNINKQFSPVTTSVALSGLFINWGYNVNFTLNYPQEGYQIITLLSKDALTVDYHEPSIKRV